jgi:signal transduction histidine kinase
MPSNSRNAQRTALMTTRVKVEWSWRILTGYSERRIWIRTLNDSNSQNIHTNNELNNQIKLYKHKIERLQQSEKNHQRLLLKLLSAQEIEKKQVSMLLHNEVSQYLTLIKLHAQRHQAALAQRPTDKTRQALDNTVLDDSLLEDIVQKNPAALDKLRHISMLLRPSTLDDIGLLATLSWFTREFKAAHPHIVLKNVINVDEKRLSPQFKTMLFRVVQEAFNNVATHSQATSISMELNVIDQRIQLKIADNGNGFVCSDIASLNLGDGVGLQIIRARVEYSGGEFSIKSSQALGTVIDACWMNIESQ